MNAQLILLTTGFTLQGAKTDLAFSIWGLLAIFLLSNRSRIRQPSLLWGILLIPGTLALMFSWDYGNSFGPWVRCVTFLALFICFAQERIDPLQLWKTVCILGNISLLLTLWDFYRHPEQLPPAGWLPINPLFNMAWMASASIFILGRLFHREFREKLKNPWRIAALIFISGAALFIFSGRQARSGILCLLVGIGVLAYKNGFGKKFLLLILLVVANVLMFKPDWVSYRFRMKESEGLQGDRLNIAKVAFNAVRDNPLWGIGPGNFDLAYDRWSYPVKWQIVKYSRTTEFVHNEYLEILVGFGIFGFAVFFIVLWEHRRRSQIQDTAAQAALWGLASIALFTPVWHLPFLFFWTMLLMSCFFQMPDGDFEASHPRSTIKLWLVGLTPLLVILGLKDWWHYRKEWDKITAFMPWDAEAWHRRGLEPSSDPQNTLHYHQQAVSKGPKNIYFIESFARFLESTATRAEDLIRAQVLYEKSLQLAPGRASNALALGRVLYRRGDYQQALKWFQEAKNLEPAYWEAYLWVARSLNATERKLEAKHLLEDLPKIRAKYLKLYEPWTDPRSAYEEMILNYDQKVIDKVLLEIKRDQGLTHK